MSLHEAPTQILDYIKDVPVAAPVTIFEDPDLVMASFHNLTARLRRQGAAAEDANDYAQTAFANYWQALREGRYSDTSDNPRGLLAVIATNIHRSAGRRQASVRMVSEDPQDPTGNLSKIVDPQPSPLSRYLDLEKEQSIRNIATKLDVVLQAANRSADLVFGHLLVGILVDGLSPQEYAAKYSVKEATVRTRLGRLKRHLDNQPKLKEELHEVLY